MMRFQTALPRQFLYAALAGTCVVLLTASTAHASSISCGFGGSATSTTGCAQEGSSLAAFDFGPYSFNLSFSTVGGPFDITVTDAFTSQSELETDGRLNNFPGYQCIPLDGVHCIDFEVNAPAPGPTTWSGDYTMTITWLLDTNGDFPNDPGNRIRILHNRGDVPGNGFDTDISIVGSYFPGSHCPLLCVSDPGMSGRDDNFQSFLVVDAPPSVPEPGTWLLVGSGIAVWCTRRRRLL